MQEHGTGELARMLKASCAAHAHRPALRGEGCELTYADLHQRAAAAAERLRTHGLQEGDTVTVRSSNHPMDFVALLSVWLAGGVAVPVHRTSPPAVVDAIQAKAECRLALDLADPTDHEGIEQLRTGTARVPGRRDILVDAAMVIFTSGSTGLPKGAVLTHRAFAGKLAQNQSYLHLGPDDVTLLVLNNTFSFGIWMALLTLCHGGLVLTRSKFSPREFLDSLARHGVTQVGVVPTMIRATFGTMDAHALEEARNGLQSTGRLRHMAIGGEPLGADLSAKLRSFIAPAGLFDIYGLTETCTSDFVLTPQSYAEHPGSIGQAAPGVDFRIVGPDGHPCAIGEAGELQLRTDFIMSGYLGDAELTDAAFVDGWFRTGDLAVCDADAYVSIVGRQKELVVRGGNKITPGEVERALMTCPAVAAAMVTGLPDPVLGQRIHALLIARAGAVIDAATLRSHLAAALEKYKHPDACYVANELPTGRTGKLDRGQFAAHVAAGAYQPLAAWVA
jgi:long-chain acyl-CoA synthetase